MHNFILDQSSSLQLLKEQAGGKALNLAKLSNQNIKVPQWVCLSSFAFDKFIDQNNLKDKIKSLVASDHYNENELENLFLSIPFNEEILSQLRYVLEIEYFNNAYLAVRSSGLDEDSADNSFAGQFSSFLYQKGIEQLEKSIKKCRKTINTFKKL